MIKLENKTVYLPFNGGTVYGKGIIKEKEPNDTNTHKYIFEGEKGKIYFNSLSDRQVKDIELIFTPEQLNQLLSEVIKNTLNTAAEKVTYKHNGLMIMNAEGTFYNDRGIKVSKESITNTFEEIYNKFKIG
jgi:hypothetical protein